MNVSEIIHLYRNSLKEIYHEGELSQIIFMVFEQVKNFSKTDLVLKNQEVLSTQDGESLKKILSELKKQKPIQYVLGYSWFYGLKLKVNEHVLIPRQETEELVDWIIKDASQSQQARRDTFRILDVCTGSACIAISLKKNLRNTSVMAIDISEKAILVAKENSGLNKTEIQFVQSDIFQDGFTKEASLLSFDIIVSNPPYILESEKKSMKKKELDYEPHLAFFVKDQDPLIFYKRIAEFAKTQLQSGGRLYFEINESKGNEVVDLLVQDGFADVMLRKDLNGKDRMIRATKNNKKGNESV